jgi:hypothetical protein
MELAVNKYNLLEQQNSMATDSMERIVAMQTTMSKTTTGKGKSRDRNRPQDAWKLVPPKATEPQIKTMN